MIILPLWHISFNPRKIITSKAIKMSQWIISSQKCIKKWQKLMALKKTGGNLGGFWWHISIFSPTFGNHLSIYPPYIASHTFPHVFWTVCYKFLHILSTHCQYFIYQFPTTTKYQCLILQIINHMSVTQVLFTIPQNIQIL